jgi:hypothetical protein
MEIRRHPELMAELVTLTGGSAGLVAAKELWETRPFVAHVFESLDSPLTARAISNSNLGWELMEDRPFVESLVVPSRGLVAYAAKSALFEDHKFCSSIIAAAGPKQCYRSIYNMNQAQFNEHRNNREYLIDCLDSEDFWIYMSTFVDMLIFYDSTSESLDREFTFVALEKCFKLVSPIKVKLPAGWAKATKMDSRLMAADCVWNACMGNLNAEIFGRKCMVEEFASRIELCYSNSIEQATRGLGGEELKEAKERAHVSLMVQLDVAAAFLFKELKTFLVSNIRLSNAQAEKTVNDLHFECLLPVMERIDDGSELKAAVKAHESMFSGAPEAEDGAELEAAVKAHTSVLSDAPEAEDDSRVKRRRVE